MLTFFMQLSPDIQRFVHDIISNEGDVKDEQVRTVTFVFMCYNDLVHVPSIIV